MRVIILCGGSGTRLNDYSLPKPLNYINGKHCVYYVLSSLPTCFDSVDFIISKQLMECNFESIVKNLCKRLKIKIHVLPYFTRGPVESAWLGISMMDIEDGEPFFFMDNDVICSFPVNITSVKNAFLGYSFDKYKNEALSFIKLLGKKVVEIKEKKKISDIFACGIYGFADKEQFRTYASKLLFNKPSTSEELYLSKLFELMLSNGVEVEGLNFPEVSHVGTLPEIVRSTAVQNLHKEQLRICFDLDNTLVTFPMVPGDYSTVQPIEKNITMLRGLKKEGHVIIIYTARRMTTHKHNVGAVIANIGKITFETLDKFDIPYDELIFGKPIADVYIDDKSLNPDMNKYESFGFFGGRKLDKPLNMSVCNRHNQVNLMNGQVVKTGPITLMKQEINYYLNIPTSIKPFFPSLYSYTFEQGTAVMNLEYIKGIVLTTLWKNKLLTINHIDGIMEFIDCLHAVKITNITPPIEEVKKNYHSKLIERFRRDEYASLPEFEYISETLLKLLKTYCDSDSLSSVEFIHGDLWFSNIILTFTNELKFFDMKGFCWKTETTGGDPMYDYGKVYQSLIGFDMMLEEDNLDLFQQDEYRNMVRKYYEQKVIERGIDLKDLKIVTCSLIMGAICAYEDEVVRQRIWKGLKSLIVSETCDVYLLD